MNSDVQIPTDDDDDDYYYYSLPLMIIIFKQIKDHRCIIAKANEPLETESTKWIKIFHSQLANVTFCPGRSKLLFF